MNMALYTCDQHRYNEFPKGQSRARCKIRGLSPTALCCLLSPLSRRERLWLQPEHPPAPQKEATVLQEGLGSHQLPRAGGG